LAADRRDAFAPEVDPARVHFLRQVHGSDVAVVDRHVPIGRELRDVDAAVTRLPERPLAVLTADCVPVLMSGPVAVGVAHAGRRGVVAGVVPAVLDALAALGQPASTLHVAIGPAIGGCCYEVEPAVQHEVVREHPAAAAETTWGASSLDLPAAVEALLEDAGVASVVRVGPCTRCAPEGRFFSHRGDPGSGRQAGIITIVPPAVAA
jgi:YfiH family protein